MAGLQLSVAVVGCAGIGRNGFPVHGLLPPHEEDVFWQGFTTKDSARDGGRGFGLALSHVVCRRSGGYLAVANDDGAVFTARFMRTIVPSRKTA